MVHDAQLVVSNGYEETDSTYNLNHTRAYFLSYKKYNQYNKIQE